MDDLESRRARRWWQAARSIRSIGRAGAFVDDVGFALLFPAPGVALPSLYEAASQQPLPLWEMAWGPDAQRVWGWKDELPRTGLAWSGRLLRGGRASFLAPDLLADCYPRTGAPDDFRQAPLGEEAHRIAETLLASGALPTVVLRQAVGLEGRHGGARFSAAVVELGRALVCTSFGAEQVGSGWPSAVLELTAPQTRPSAGKRVACLAVYPTISGVRGMSSHSRWPLPLRTSRMPRGRAHATRRFPRGHRPGGMRYPGHPTKTARVDRAVMRSPTAVRPACRDGRALRIHGARNAPGQDTCGGRGWYRTSDLLRVSNMQGTAVRRPVFAGRVRP